MNKVTIIGHYGGGKVFLDGQTVKTKILTEELCHQLGAEQVRTIDTFGGKRNLIKAPFQVVKSLKQSKNVVILPASNGVRVYSPLLVFFRRLFKGRKIHYVVIGGWLPKLLRSKKRLEKTLKKFDGIYVETNTLKNALEEKGFNNVSVIPNCKKLSVIKEEELIYCEGEPLKLCTFSRVMKEKGIEDAVYAVKQVNKKYGRVVYALDIYGQIDGGQTDWFEEFSKGFPDFVNYCGLVPFDKSVETLKDYFALLFPTRFYTEGIPGTIIDAYAAGVPVISAKWESFSDIVDEGITGFGYAFGDKEKLKELLIEFAEKPERVNNIKVGSLKKVQEFIPEKVVGDFVKKAEI